MNHRMKQLLLGLCASAMISPVASADVVYGPANKSPANPNLVTVPSKRPTADKPPVVFLKNGKSAAEIHSTEVIQGMGNDVKLGDAMKALVPGDFNVSYFQLDENAIEVSWRGGRPWYDLLTEIGAEKGLEFDITGDPKHVLVSRSDARIISSDPMFETLPNMQGCVEPMAAKTGSPLVDQVYAFHIRAGLTFNEIIKEWAKASCWHVDIEGGIEYQIVADHVLYGNFRTASVSFIQQFTNAEPPMRAKYHEANRVLQIRPVKRSGGF